MMMMTVIIMMIIVTMMGGNYIAHWLVINVRMRVCTRAHVCVCVYVDKYLFLSAPPPPENFNDSAL